MGMETGVGVRQGASSSQVLPASSSKAPSIDPNVLGICSLAWDPKIRCLNLPSAIRWGPQFIRTLLETHGQPKREWLLSLRIRG